MLPINKHNCRTCFLDSANFLKAAKSHRKNIFKRKNDTPSFDQSTRKKVLSSIDCTPTGEKKRELHCFSKKLISRKTQTKGKFCSFGHICLFLNYFEW